MNGFDSNRTPDRMPRIPVRLAFDTAECPLAEGVRRRHVTSRHLLYEAEDLCLDLRIERDPRGSRFAVAGQLVDRRAPATPVSPAPVFVFEGGAVLASTATNHLGEFLLDIEPRPSMTLGVATGGGQLIEVPLDRRMTRREGEGSEA